MSSFIAINFDERRLARQVLRMIGATCIQINAVYPSLFFRLKIQQHGKASIRCQQRASDETFKARGPCESQAQALLRTRSCSPAVGVVMAASRNVIGRCRLAVSSSARKGASFGGED